MMNDMLPFLSLLKCSDQNELSLAIYPKHEIEAIEIFLDKRTKKRIQIIPRNFFKNSFLIQVPGSGMWLVFFFLYKKIILCHCTECAGFTQLDNVISP